MDRPAIPIRAAGPLCLGRSERGFLEVRCKYIKTPPSGEPQVVIVFFTAFGPARWSGPARFPGFRVVEPSRQPSRGRSHAFFPRHFLLVIHERREHGCPVVPSISGPPDAPYAGGLPAPRVRSRRGIPGPLGVRRRNPRGPREPGGPRSPLGKGAQDAARVRVVTLPGSRREFSPADVCPRTRDVPHPLREGRPTMRHPNLSTTVSSSLRPAPGRNPSIGPAGPGFPHVRSS